MGRVVHFEFFGEEPARLVEFYKDVFGWEVSAWQGPFEYHLVTTGPRGKAGIDGAIARFGNAGDQRTVVTIDVDDVDRVAGAVAAAGGSIVSPKSPIPGVGWFAYVTDPAGMVFGVMQPDANAGVEAPAEGASAEQREMRDAWAEVGERLREFGTTLGDAVNETTGPHGQRLREQAERTAESIGEASRVAADKARPHVIGALERVSVELGELASRLSKEAEPGGEPAPPAEKPDDEGDGS